VGVRRNAREMALQLLYQGEFHPEGDLAPFWPKVHPDARAFAERLTEGVRRHRARIDGLIRMHAKNWSPDRMTLVDRSILRLSIFEILYLEETPRTVAINEAVEIAKKYGAEDSGAFVNGILDQIHPALPEDAQTAAREGA